MPEHRDFASTLVFREVVLKQASERILDRPSCRAFAYADNPSWSPDGRKIAFFRRHERHTKTNRDGIHVLDLRTNKLQRLTSGDAPEWSPDGHSLAFHRGESLCVLELRTGRVRTLLTTPGIDHESYRWSPDGRSIAYDVRRGDLTSIWIFDVTSERKRFVASRAALLDWTA